MNVNYVIKRPIITEKSLEATKLNCYTFEVAEHATKSQIKAAVNTLFKVDVVEIQTSIIKSVARATGRRRFPGETAAAKKAIVKIKPGQTIKVFETKG